MEEEFKLTAEVNKKEGPKTTKSYKSPDFLWQLLLKTTDQPSTPLSIKSKHKMLIFFFFKKNEKRLKHLKVLRQKHRICYKHTTNSYHTKNNFSVLHLCIKINLVNKKDEHSGLTDHILCSYTISNSPAQKHGSWGSGTSSAHNQSFCCIKTLQQLHFTLPIYTITGARTSKRGVVKKQ